MKILIKLPREIKEEEKVLKYLPEERFIIDTNKDFHTKFFKIKKENFQKNYFELEKEKFVLMDLSEQEKIQSFKRGAQVITAKDAGIIISKTGINKKTKVLDAGAGSGSLSAHLSLICEVTAVEKLEAHYEIAKNNLKGYDVKLLKGDIYNIDLNQEFDVFTLDVPEPWNAIKTANKHLKIGGYLVLYCPQITQVQKTIINLPENFLHQETIELIERQWKVTDKILRPQTKDHQHTAFLSFIRKIRN